LLVKQLKLGLTRRKSNKRVSYNGYYMSFPRMRRGFDSRHPHHLLDE
jgi:hypothetical protein